MIRVAALALCVAAAGCASGPLSVFAERASADAEARAVAVERVVSPGGIEAWLVSDATVPVIVLEASFEGVGAAADPAGRTGLSSFLATMLTEGAGDLDADAFKVRLEELTMGLGASSGWDRIDVRLSTLSENRDAAFGMLRLALAAPRFDEAPFARLKRQSEVSLRQREASPSFLANRALDRAVLTGHPYARRMEAADLAAISRADLRAAHAGLSRDRLKITVSGAIDAATLGRLLDETFGALPATATASAPAIPEAAPKPGQGLIVEPLPQPQSLVLFAGPGLQESAPDWLAFSIANFIVGGGGFTSRLMQEVREERGLVYGVSTGPRLYEKAALVVGSAQTENEDAAAAIALIRAELGRFAQDGATDAEIAAAKRYLTGSFPLDLDSNAKIADVLHQYHVDGRDIDYVNRRNALILAVDKAAVNAAAARYFAPDTFTFVVVGQPQGVTSSTAP